MNTWKLFTYLSIIGQPSSGHDVFAYPDGPTGPVTLPLHIYGSRRFRRDLDGVNRSSGCEGSDGQMAITLHIPLQGGSTELENEFAKRLYSKSVRESSGGCPTDLDTAHIWASSEHRMERIGPVVLKVQRLQNGRTRAGRTRGGRTDGRTETILYPPPPPYFPMERRGTRNGIWHRSISIDVSLWQPTSKY